MVRKIQWALLLCLVMIGGSVAKSTPTAVAQSNPPAEILQLVNQVRAVYGLPPFKWNNTLAVAAQNQANYMAANNIYSHTGAGGSTPQTRANAAGYNGRATENIVGGTSLTPQQGVTWWRNSAVHFNTMISDYYTEAGVGYAVGHDQNFYALVAGRPSNSPATTASTPRDDVPDDAAAALAVVAPIILSQPREDGAIVHTVGSGQSLWAIAARYEVEIADILLFNNLSEDSTIQPGDELTIRLAEGQAPPPTPTPPASHIVKKGDTPWTIAAWYSISLDELMLYNGLDDNDVLQPGDEVRVRLLPGELPPPTATPPTTHIIQKGETLWDVALRYGLSLDELLQYNNLSQDVLLTIGMELRIAPVQPTATAVTATATPSTPNTTATPTAVVQISPEPPTATPMEATAVASTSNTPTPMIDAQPSASDNWSRVVTASAILAGIGLTFLATAAIIVIRKEE